MSPNPRADVLVIGAGLIGLAIARELHDRGLRVLILERGGAGQEASWAGAGMLAAEQMSADAPLRPLARASAAIYAEFCRALEAETGCHVDYRPIGTKLAIAPGNGGGPSPSAGRNDDQILSDHCVDNRLLVTALRASILRRAPRLRLLENTPVTGVTPDGGAWTVSGPAGRWTSAHVLNASGAWAAAIAGAAVPARPRKGQLLAVQGPPGLLPRILVGEGVYLVPRSDGRIVIGATLEDNGFDKTVIPAIIARLRARAEALLPAIAGLPEIERWAGLRPGTPDDLPYLGALGPGLWVATGHFRDGILLTPITAQLIADLVTARPLSATGCLDLSAFSPTRQVSSSGPA